MMSLGAGTLKVSVGPKASSREEVYMATLEVGTTPQAAHLLTPSHWEISGEILIDDNTYLKRILTILPATQMISKQLLPS